MTGRPEKRNKTVSEDYGTISVHSKMEAKSEDGPEMDVDGVIPDEQNGKKCNRIYSCGLLILCSLCMQLLGNGNTVPVKPLFRINISSQALSNGNIDPMKLILRIHIPSHSHIIPPIDNHYIVYAWPLLLTRYLYNIVQPLAVISSASKYVIVPSLPYKLCHMISNLYRELFRIRRYRE